MNPDYPELIPQWIREFEPQQFAKGPPITDTGISVAITNTESTVYRAGFGFRDRAGRLPVTTDTVFPIASITKSFTAAALIQALHDRGGRTPDTLVREVESTLRFAIDSELTYTDLLSHRTGLPRHDNLWARAFFEQTDILQRLPHLEINPEDGSGFRRSFQYNNLLYGLCGKSIETLIGKSWDEFIEANFLRPLQMNQTWTAYAKVPSTVPLALPYFREQLSEIFERWTVPGAAAMFSTAESLTPWLRWHLTRGRSMPAGSIPEDFFETWLWKAQNDATGTQEGASCFSATDYALGWFSDRLGEERVLHHGGSIHGLSALAAFLPERALGVVVLVNQPQSRLPRMLAKRIMENALGLAPVPDVLPIPAPIFLPETVELVYPDSVFEAYPSNQTWPTSALGSYFHTGYGSLRITGDEKSGSDPRTLFLHYGKESWPLHPISETQAIADCSAIGIPARIRITRTEDAILAPFNIAPGCVQTRFVRVAANFSGE